MTVIDKRSSTEKLIQDVALARQKLLASSDKINAAISTLGFEIRNHAVRGSTIAFAVLGGVLLERAVYRDRSSPSSLANAMVTLKKIVEVTLTFLSIPRPSDDTHGAAPPSSDA